MKNLKNMTSDSNYFTKWFKAAAIRAVKTFAQTALGMMTVGAALEDVQWAYIASVACVAAIYSVLTSIAGLPEVDMDGTGDDSK